MTKIFRMILLLCLPMVGMAQNGVTVSNIEISAGTVSFNVSWEKISTPALWSDTVWVFVNYNAGDAMKRLPVTGGGATAGTVTKLPGNDRGLRIVGNARTKNSFSAKVELYFDSKLAVNGACAYASNYPPVAEYTAPEEIKLKGTPPYDILIAGAGTYTETRRSGDVFTLPSGFTFESFTDKTGAPGIIKCNELPTVASSSGASRCGAGTVMLTATASSADAVIAWYEASTGGSAVHTGNTYTPDVTATRTYYAQARQSTTGCESASRTAVMATIKTSGCGVNQPQGSCTYTEPSVVGTFASFPSNYSASTYVVLTDERDNKNYPVVKISDRWIMARNLNYQEGLTWQERANSPSTEKGFNTALIGHFWCPGGSGSTASTPAQESCEVWGALYSWETAMMLDGYGTWTEVNTYNTGAASATNSKVNHGRTAHSGNTIDGRGICPPDWHVPTDFEWGVILDGMEKNGGIAHQNAASSGGYGINAGRRARATCTCPEDVNCVDDNNARWKYNSGTLGEDIYGFRGLPAGYRDYNGSAFNYRGTHTFFWSSSANSSTLAWYRVFNYGHATVSRYASERSYGFPVRCIRD